MRARRTSAKYYATGEQLLKLNMKLIELISSYAVISNNTDVMEEIVEIVRYITTASSAEDVLRYVTCYDYTDEKTLTTIIGYLTSIYN